MIVLDEQLEDPRIAEAIERWYPGKVINILDARRESAILDEAVPTILHRLKDPTLPPTTKISGPRLPRTQLTAWSASTFP